MRTQTAPTIRLKDYLPSDYLVDKVDMEFELHSTETMVRTKTGFLRNEGVDAGMPLVLDGDELNLEEIRLNGSELGADAFTVSADSLTLHNPPAGPFTLEVVTKLNPFSNRKLMGLYQSSGVYCTQCEAEGFRRITYALDRPDVMAVYTVRLEANKRECPVLLANGNPAESGDLPDGRHFAVWHDPHPKPSYLFAVVGGALDVLSDDFTTRSGRHVDLNIYVEPGKAQMASYAMDALKRSMVWDEEKYGCEYDLDVFNIVAVSDFNMGAMENKGLNVFNDKYVLADPNLATDGDFMNIEAIIAHEYFHNWTGNRITCRDWFQLCLKEGLTVYRDQEFSADQRSRPVQRIQQVRILKAGQFSEDAGPLAHNVRPHAYQEINNFYTATVYQKGAELVRMLATLVGPEAYRASTDLYLSRHDGEAARVEDWLRSFEDAAGMDTDQFSRWYEQAGTPQVTAEEEWDDAKGVYSLTLRQSVPSTPGQKRKKLVPIPIRFGLLDGDGQDCAISTRSGSVKGDVIILDERELTVRFTGLEAKPVPSLLRGFSAPVTLTMDEPNSALLHRARHDSDLYNRWAALNTFALQECAELAQAIRAGERRKPSKALLSAIVRTAMDETIEPAFRAQTLALPSAQDIARHIKSDVDPNAVFQASKRLQKALGKALGEEGLALWKKQRKRAKKAEDTAASGLRALANALLPLLVLGKVDGARDAAEIQFSKAKNMTDRLAALSTLIYCQSKARKAKKALAKFYSMFKDEPLVVDKWFSIQAMLPGKRGLQRVRKLVGHKDFSLDNPNRARALLGAYAAGNLSGFHGEDGAGYNFYADQVLAIDQTNPQLAARLLTLMNNWRMFEPTRSQAAKAALERIAATGELSKDTREIVERSLT